MFLRTLFPTWELPGLAKEAKGYSRIVIEKPFGHDLKFGPELDQKVKNSRNTRSTGLTIT